MCCPLVKLTITLLLLCISRRIIALPLRQPFLEHRVATVRCENNRRVVDVCPNRTNQRFGVAAEKHSTTASSEIAVIAIVTKRTIRLLNWTYAFCFVICPASLLAAFQAEQECPAHSLRTSDFVLSPRNFCAYSAPALSPRQCTSPAAYSCHAHSAKMPMSESQDLAPTADPLQSAASSASGTSCTSASAPSQVQRWLSHGRAAVQESPTSALATFTAKSPTGSNTFPALSTIWMLIRA